MSTTRRCSRCKQDKPESEFCFDKRRQNYRSWCKTCRAEYNKTWRDANPGYMTEYWKTHERPIKKQKRPANYARDYMQRRRRRHEAIARGDCPKYASAKARRFAAILATVRPALTSGQE